MAIDPIKDIEVHKTIGLTDKISRELMDLQYKLLRKSRNRVPQTIVI